MTVDAYTADEDDELSFPKGETVDVLQKSLDGWWLIRHRHKTGLAPATFLKKVEQSSPGDHNPVSKKGGRWGREARDREEGGREKGWRREGEGDGGRRAGRKETYTSCLTT